MNEWMDEWLILKKKPACVHLRIIVYKIKAKNNIKKKTNKQNKQERPLTLKLTGIVKKPRENSEMFENVKVRNN